jgi:UDP-N-acetylmuramate-alanine ligase
LSLQTTKALYYANEENEIKEKIALIKDKIDTLIFLGAGDIYDCAKTLIKSAKNIF